MYAVRTIVLCVLAAASLQAQAQGAFSGSEVLRNCEQAERVLATPAGVPSNANLRQAGMCLGFLVGLEQGIIIGESSSGGADAKSLFCVPPNVTYEQRGRVALLWLRNHPERLHEYASPLIALAFRDAFPCGTAAFSVSPGFNPSRCLSPFASSPPPPRSSARRPLNANARRESLS